MVKLNLKRRKNREEEILEDVDLTAIVEQKRRQQQQDRETKTEVEEGEKQKEERNIAMESTGLDFDSYLQERFLTWLIEQAMSNDNEFNMLMEAIDEMDINRLRMLCKIALRKLKERAT